MIQPSLSLLADAGKPLLSMHGIDYFIVAFYFILVLGIGFYLKKYASTGDDFFMAGHKMTAWIAGLSFISANLSTLETMGWSAMAAEDGMLGAHAYLVAAFPAILFLALVMMPFYYISKIHSVPGYLKLRYGEGARSLAGISFAIMTVCVCGVGMFSMAKVLELILGWNLNVSIWISSLCVAIYVGLGGLLSAIFNEVLQYFLIWLGLLLVPILGMYEMGGLVNGWHNLMFQLNHIPLQALHGQTAESAHKSMTSLWACLSSPDKNVGGMDAFGMIFGNGLAIAFGYWCTDFLQVQRVMAAKDLRAAENGTIIGAGLKMLVLLIVTLPGLLGLVILAQKAHITLVGENSPMAHQPGYNTYNNVLPLLMGRYLGPGLLGLGVTAMIAGFMSGMAGNVSAFATVWTYDVYKPLINKTASDAHYVTIGRWSSIIGVLLGIATAYMAYWFSNILVYLQVLVVFFIVPLFGTVILGMLWKRATEAGGFWGFLLGILTSVAQWVWIHLMPTGFNPSDINVKHLPLLGLSESAGGFSINTHMAFWSLLATMIVVVAVSLVTKPKSDKELQNLVMGLTPRAHVAGPIFQRPIFWGGVLTVIFLGINIWLW